MAITVGNLSCVGYGNGQKLWLYKSTEASSTINASGYFNTTDVPNMAAGDFIIVVAATGGTPQAYGAYVSAIAAASSTISPFKGAIT